MACTSMASLSVAVAGSTEKSSYIKINNFLVASLEASISDADDKLIALKDAKIVVESKDENKIQLRVDVTGIETQKVFNKVLTDLARQAPPIPGFRREKGGKTTKVPREFLLQILGEERVTKFVVQEIVTSTVADYVKEENLNIKDKKVSTSQSAEELKVSFTPGKDFWFNAVLELEESENS
ncbi:Trigger factor [Gossypium arboreum]|uniref:peptidylprolyl isomerase n=1 Tax=Gossypium arboreum TaxID=29729 RepID=A0A0B0P5P6_GOSAR|nr:Trigger factor [Gossypium arboreum]